MLVLVNVRDAASKIELPAMWNNKTVINLMTGEEMKLSQHITMQPYQYLLLHNQ